MGIGGRRRQVLEEVAQVAVWFQAVDSGGLDEGVNGGRGVGAARVAGKQPVLAANGKWADGILSQIVVWAQPTVLQIDDKAVPLLAGIIDGLAEQALGRRGGNAGIKQRPQLVQDRSGLFRPQGGDLLRLELLLLGLALHPVELADQVQDGMGRTAFALLAGSLLDLDKFSPDMGQTAKVAQAVGDRPNESTGCSGNGATECSPNGAIR